MYFFSYCWAEPYAKYSDQIWVSKKKTAPLSQNALKYGMHRDPLFQNPNQHPQIIFTYFMCQMCQGTASGAYDNITQSHICFSSVVVLNKSGIPLTFS